MEKKTKDRYGFDYLFDADRFDRNFLRETTIENVEGRANFEDWNEEQVENVFRVKPNF